MNRFFSICWIIAFCAGCNTSQNKAQERSSLSDAVPEPDIAERLKYEALQALAKSGCVFTKPDTSLAGIKLRDPKSTLTVIGNKDRADAFEHFHYRSKNGGETLTLTQYSDEAALFISVIQVEPATEAHQEYRKLNIDTFKTEKGITLGMTKKQVTDRLGKCCIALDSTKDYIKLYYRILPAANNQPKLPNSGMYFASYSFLNDQLTKFEFGYEHS